MDSTSLLVPPNVKLASALHSGSNLHVPVSTRITWGEYVKSSYAVISGGINRACSRLYTSFRCDMLLPVITLTDRQSALVKAQGRCY